MTRKLGLIASYLSIATITFALVTAIILTGAVIPSAAAYIVTCHGFSFEFLAGFRLTAIIIVIIILS